MVGAWYQRAAPVIARETAALHTWSSRAPHVITRGSDVLQPRLPADACHHVLIHPRLHALQPRFTSGQDADRAAASVQRPYHG